MSSYETADLSKPPMTGAEWSAGGPRIPHDTKSAGVPNKEEAAASRGALRVFDRMTPLLERNQQFARTYVPVPLGLPAAQVVVCHVSRPSSRPRDLVRTPSR